MVRFVLRHYDKIWLRQLCQRCYAGLVSRTGSGDLWMKYAGRPNNPRIQKNPERLYCCIGRVWTRWLKRKKERSVVVQVLNRECHDGPVVRCRMQATERTWLGLMSCLNTGEKRCPETDYRLVLNCSKGPLFKQATLDVWTKENEKNQRETASHRSHIYGGCAKGTGRTTEQGIKGSDHRPLTYLSCPWQCHQNLPNAMSLQGD